MALARNCFCIQFPQRPKNEDFFLTQTLTERRDDHHAVMFQVSNLGKHQASSDFHKSK